MEQLRNGVDAVDGNIHVAIVVVVAKGAAARGRVFQDAGTSLLRDFFKTAVAEIAVEVLMLGILKIGLRIRNLGIDVAIRHEQVEPAVVVHIKEANAPAQQSSVDAQTTGISAVFKVRIAEIGVERVSVASKVSLNHVERSIAVVISDRNTHAGLRLRLGRKRGTAFNGYVTKGPILLIQVERCRRGIIGDVDIGPAVVVEVGSRHAEAVGANRRPHTGFLTHVGKGAVAVVVIEQILSSGQTRRPAGDEDPLVGAGSVLGLGGGG